jgi:hypothetical protein
MNAQVTWPDLLQCYDNIEFTNDVEGTLIVGSAEILRTILLVDKDDDAANDSNLYAKEELHRPAIGDQIVVHVGSPKLSLGILAMDLDALLSAPKGFVEFPKHFYVIDGRLSERDVSAGPLTAYRAVVSLVRLFAESAAFMDQLDQKLFYFKDGKIELSIRYSATTLRSVDTNAVERLLKQFTDELHRAQKLAILADAIAALVKAQSEATRFEYIVQNVGHLAASLEDGYRLFVSSFSYDKIRSDLENASLDFVSRIHKTFVDVQSQLLGIPIATIVVASQLKPASACGVEVWTNVAVLAGAWIFAAFLGASIINQFLTLNAISREVQRQKKRLEGDFAAISSKFVGTFTSLTRRIFWYRVLYLVICGVGIAGAGFATFAYRALTTANVVGCGV